MAYIAMLIVLHFVNISQRMISKQVFCIEKLSFESCGGAQGSRFVAAANLL